MLEEITYDVEEEKESNCEKIEMFQKDKIISRLF